MHRYRLFLLVVLVIAVGAVLAAPGLDALVLAAQADPSIVPPTDPRSEGEGPGLVGSPVFVALAVIVLGVVTAVLTALVVRLTRRD